MRLHILLLLLAGSATAQVPNPPSNLIVEGGSVVPTPPAGAQPFFSDDFEGYPAGGSVSGQGANGFRFVGARETQVSELIAQSGRRSLRFRYDSTASDAHIWAEQRFDLGRRLTEVWVEYWLYYPNGQEGFGSMAMNHLDGPSSDNNKFFRLWGGGQDAYGGNPNKVGMSTRPGSGSDGAIFFEYTIYGSSGTGRGNGPSPIAWENTRGRWIQVRQHYKHVSAPAENDGHMRLWQDGRLVLEFRNVDQAYHSIPYWDSGYLMGYDNTHIATQGGGQILIFMDGLKFWDRDPGWR